MGGVSLHGISAGTKRIDYLCGSVLLPFLIYENLLASERDPIFMGCFAFVQGFSCCLSYLSGIVHFSFVVCITAFNISYVSES